MDASKIRANIFKSQCETCEYSTAIAGGNCNGECDNCKRYLGREEQKCVCIQQPTVKELVYHKCLYYIRRRFDNGGNK